MNTHRALDQESFQKLLADAFLARESQIDSQSLSAIVEIQRLITSGDLDLDGALHLIADLSRDTANATGVAIGLLEGNQLIYHAGSGSAAPHTGQRVPATFTVSADVKTSREILRVENAETDARIQAEICRQFGAKALLILLIYHDRTVAGVIEVLFSEAHTFQDREVRTYQLMAGLVGEAVSRAPIHQKSSPADVSIMPPAVDIDIDIDKSPGGDQAMPSPSNDHVLGKLSDTRSQLAAAATITGQRDKRAFQHRPDGNQSRWNRFSWNPAVAGAVSALVIACGLAYSVHRSALPLAGPALQSSGAHQHQAPSASARPAPVNSVPDAAPVAHQAAKDAKLGFQRVRVGDNEVDYVADDVTMRYFTPKPTPHQAQLGYRNFNIGNDVTVRYFAPKPAVLPATQPVASATQPANRPLPATLKSVSPKLAQ
jgi:hypothetical protein